MQFTITQAQLGDRPPVVKPVPEVLKFLGEEKCGSINSVEKSTIKIHE